MQKSKFRPTFGNYPFLIHSNPLLEKTAYSTHTHGLNDKGWPEFMIDPACYGSHGNAARINETYDYFRRPRRKKILNRIMKGETIEIPINKLCENWDGESYPICFRLVPNTFEAVKLAYCTDDGDVDPNLVVVQIYVKGDDYALEDGYYEGGVTW